MDRIALFRIFVRVVDCASFSRAADLAGLPRSSVSAAIQTLEARLGARLLHRTTRKVVPTLDGTAFYERCLRLIQDVEEAENLFRQTGAAAAGRIRVDVPSRIGRLIVIPALPDFLARHPGLDVEIGVTDRAVNLVEEGVDCVLRAGTPAESGLVARAIGRLPLINVASPGYLDRYGVPRTPADLKDHLAVRYASPSTGRIEDWEWLEDGKAKRLDLPGRVTVSSAEGYIAACLAGLGLIQIPAYDVRDQLAAGELVEVMDGYRAGDLPMTLLYPHRRHLSRRLQAFAEWLVPLLSRHLS